MPGVPSPAGVRQWMVGCVCVVGVWVLKDKSTPPPLLALSGLDEL